MNDLAEPWRFPHAFWWGWSMAWAVVFAGLSALSVSAGMIIDLGSASWLSLVPTIAFGCYSVAMVLLSLEERRCLKKWSTK
jgi:hypothetical protein